MVYLTFEHAYANIKISITDTKTMGRHARQIPNYNNYLPGVDEVESGVSERVSLRVGARAIDSVITRPPQIYRRPQIHRAPTDGVDLEKNSELPILARSFEDAKAKIKKPFGDKFIDNALDGGLEIDGEKVYFIKSYLDNVPMSQVDIEVARDPKRIAAMYRETSEMVRRNLRILRSSSVGHARISEIKAAKDAYMDGLGRQIPLAEQAIVDWCDDNKSNKYPNAAIDYYGFQLDGKDILDAETRPPRDVVPNFKIQRQLGGTFVMAYSDTKLREQATDKRNDRRIYLNSEIEAAPQIFEEILRVANEKGLGLQLKMLQRATELASVHQKQKGKPELRDTLRGDGIVIYVSHKYEQAVLDEVLAIVERHAESFRGRSVSRTPAKIADGVAVGDEVGIRGESLTSHRSAIIEQTAQATRLSGLTGSARREFFRQEFRRLSAQNNIDPDNMAFNA